MRLQSPAHRLFFPITRYIYRHADAVVVYGEHIKRYLMSEGVPAERIFVAAHAVENEVYNGQVPEVEKATLRRQLKITPEQKIVLYLGRLEQGKGLTYLLEAFASLAQDDAVLVLAGTGSEGPYLEQLAREKGLAERVRFPGYIPTEKTIHYYAIAWVYVLPSVTTATFKEPWGLVVNEAFNQGLPVIATDAVGAAAGGLVQDGVNGLIVPERDSHALAGAISRILDDPDLRKNMAQNAQKTIAKWDNEEMVKGFREAIQFVTD
jgi:glycosyltransferase involved in cell wall biosynthesis